MKLVILLLVICLYGVSGGKVLSFFNMMSYSHYILGKRLLEELARKGHDVTVINPYDEGKGNNITYVKLDGMQKKWDETFPSLEVILNFKTMPSPLLNYLIHDGVAVMTDFALEHQTTQELLKNSTKYDVIILEQFYNEPLKMLCYHFQAPCISMSTLSSYSDINHLVANPAPPSYVPDFFFDFSSKMSFLQRVRNTLLVTFQHVMNELVYLPRGEKIAQKYFPGAPRLQEVIYNISLIFLNSHPSVTTPVPHVPKMIEIGGFHIKPNKPLPKDLEDFMNSAEDGVIFFSLGSNVLSKDLPEEKLKEILSAFSKLKMNVLWKFEETHLKLPDNVKISKWMPQQDILAHPKLKLFVTHGGLLSTLEAIHHGIPMVGIPFYADQHMNMKVNVENGFAEKLEFQDLSGETLVAAINKVLSDEKYAENAKKRSTFLRDRPVQPLDLAVYWVEYLIRHKNVDHLRSAALDLNWYQYLVLDVIAFLFIVVSLPIFLIIYFIRKFWNSKSKIEHLKKKQ